MKLSNTRENMCLLKKNFLTRTHMQLDINIFLCYSLLYITVFIGNENAKR